MQSLESIATVDLLRHARTGAPEVIYAEGKTAEQTVAIARHMLERNGRCVISRTPPATAEKLANELPSGLVWDRSPDGGTIRLWTETSPTPSGGGEVGIVAAGTSDLPVAEEAAALCREMGCTVHRVTDVGVAGLHRLFEPLQRLLSIPVDALIVVAGMDGALPSVVGGLVGIPIIGVPTSVGYGHGGNGEAALGTMLQSCAPGLTVVNIDNGVGAGIAAGRIAVHAARARAGAAK